MGFQLPNDIIKHNIIQYLDIKSILKLTETNKNNKLLDDKKWIYLLKRDFNEYLKYYEEDRNPIYEEDEYYDYVNFYREYGKYNNYEYYSLYSKYRIEYEYSIKTGRQKLFYWIKKTYNPARLYFRTYWFIEYFISIAAENNDSDMVKWLQKCKLCPERTKYNIMYMGKDYSKAAEYYGTVYEYINDDYDSN